MRNRFLLSVGLSDLAALLVAMALASEVVFGVLIPWESIEGTEVLPMLGVITGAMVLMSVATAQMSGPGVPRPTYGRMFMIMMGTGMITATALVFAREIYFSRLFLISTGAAWVVLSTAHRIVRRRRPWTERLLLITAEKELAEDLAASGNTDVVSVLRPDFDATPEPPDRDVTIAVDLRSVLSPAVAAYLSSCDMAGYRIRPFSSRYEYHTGRVPLVHLSEGWEISAPLLEVAPWLPGKRVFDVIVTSLTLPIWLLMAGGVGAFIRFSSSGPAIFRQERTGLGGRTFTMYKFRTMSEDAEKDGPRFATASDPRLIRGGAFLRKSRLDEIPQLWNVLRGDMSLVGPRAEQVSFAQLFAAEIPFYNHRHLVRPGVTGWAQVSYGYADDKADTIEKLTYDLYYIKNMSPVMDLKVLWESIWTVLTGDGAR